MSTTSTDIVILAAGKGTRMQSALPKVLHPLAGRPLLEHVLTSADSIANGNKIIVTGHGADQVEQAVAQCGAVFVQQTEQLGTAHAVQMALPHLRSEANVLILYGDVPLISPETISNILGAVDKNHIALLTISLDDPTGYGRIIRNGAGEIESIVEQKDASAEQLDIKEINTGVLALGAEQLHAWLPQINNNNAQGEYYLTDLIAIARSNGFHINSIHPSSSHEIEGVNNRQQLSRLERAYQLAQAEALMLSGTTLADPKRFDQRGTITAGTDNSIDVNCVFEGDVVLGSGVSIGPNCHISDSTIGDGVEIKANSVIESAIVGNGAIVGPFARLRPGTKLGNNTKVGNFVETKKALVGDGSKINHLSYVGDATLGQGVNIGAGTITCNYDGVNKHTTDIGNDAFIGSNSTLIAPVSVGDKGFVAAGTSVSKDVPEDSLAVGRAKQRNISGWKRPTKKDD
ncbi:MAG: bifunctional UDP-N-acetylglucosamine diphosphorylase/glucosamine-1-phosphate N-acetyltransferase GlmU [Porticoccaceae bacterium]|nr:bifunctional UDP-N-acetylglucosamine diphosphorylase/glucosamine-1-phosphate N-acetyltransferase GlmU [Porticoccaceae bacterium]